jgi:hypothetical protein
MTKFWTVSESVIHLTVQGVQYIVCVFIFVSHGTKMVNIVTCILIGRQRLAKKISQKQTRGTVGRLLLANGAVNIPHQQ